MCAHTQNGILLGNVFSLSIHQSMDTGEVILGVYIYIYIHTHTHRHTHIYIYTQRERQRQRDRDRDRDRERERTTRRNLKRSITDMLTKNMLPLFFVPILSSTLLLPSVVFIEHFIYFIFYSL